ncbi:hypothetical protein [Roseibium sp. RKSG952]|uniref:hypothetical protein n=1 Tax=Roseibium sp. RKSG952 TaxID=2529384 RepID=UPI0012BD6C1E|nr:hypothetical protein [Roseibium sp. RKSG952]MTH95250.1 hypothetical protein [Roseibium sp. RKSG952]
MAPDFGNPITKERAEDIRAEIFAAVARAEATAAKYPEPTPFPDIEIPQAGVRKLDWSGEDLLSGRDENAYPPQDGLLLTKKRGEAILAAERIYSMNTIRFTFVAALFAMSPGFASAQQVQSPGIMTLVDDLAELDLDKNGLVEAYEVDAVLSAAEGEAFASWEREWNAAFSVIGSNAPESAARSEYHEVLRKGLETLDLDGDGTVTYNEWKWRIRESEDAALLFSEIGPLMRQVELKEVSVKDLQSFVDATEAVSGADVMGPGALPTNFNAYRASVMADFEARAVDGAIDLTSR